ncbi:hypothetical protein HXX76_005544 [Chlamydomonas incerta]|uniref:CRAL-TRIO domain-containing protein n=1 Tax=Chlamydomonas incerta TaxID=51695 RepID=A0A835T7W2_CHLIN|nr:hypothetical protein HXX76_005544 [Chlamydomonas incerta]|eukprot:KAG2437928.1 hypothetical protein HXX76_005544 [Chlamydomonas incerta]
MALTLTSHGFGVEGRGLTSEQLGKLAHFKRVLVSAGEFDEQRFDDHDLARFLKARNYDLQAAKQMWEGMIAWRRENRVDNIHDWFVFHERSEYEKVFPTGLHKTDKEGHPVLIQQLGRVNIGALYKVTTDDRIRMAHIAENEQMRRTVFPACSYRAGRPVDKLFTIIDLEGIAFTSVMRTTSILKMYMQMDSNNYPETLARMAIINAPGWFSTSWSAIKGVLNGETVKKIEILGKDYQAALLRHIPRENLLAQYGGTSAGSLTENIGPWQEPLPVPRPLLPEPGAELTPELPATPRADDTAMLAAEAGDELRALGGRVSDQHGPRDVQVRNRSVSPVRPGAVKGAGGVEHHHPAPASPPLAKRPHMTSDSGQAPTPQQQQGGQQLQQQGQGQHPLNGTGGSPAPSVSDTSSDVGSHNMTAPLLSNFLHASSSPLQSAQSGGGASGTRSPPVGGGPGAGGASAGTTGGSLARRSSSSGGGIVSGLVAGLQAAASHIANYTHVHHTSATHVPLPGGPPADAPPGGLGSPVGPGHPPARPGALASPLHPSVAAGVPSAAARAVAAGQGAGPAQLQLTPRDDADTLMSAASAMYSLPSALSPISVQDAHDTASSRPLDSYATGGSSGTAAAGLPSMPPSAGPTGGSRGATSAGPTGGSTSGHASGAGGGGVTAGPTGSGMLMGTAASATLSMFGSANPGSVELMYGAQSGALQPQGTGGGGGGDNDDAESVRMSVMSQRSFYSAISHLDASSSSGITSPNSMSEQTRRWSVQRELHAAAIASAVAATAERRAAVAAAASAAAAAAAHTGGSSALASAAASFTGAGHNRLSGGAGPGLGGVPYVVPPAAQQAFGSYLDQPPPYGAHGGHAANGVGPRAPGRASQGGEGGDQQSGAGREADAAASASGRGTGVGRQHGGGGGGQHSRSASRGELASLGGGGGGGGANGDVVVHIGDVDGGPHGGGMSRSGSAATLNTPDECSLGAVGAVKWARGWFFRRRNYGRLIENDAHGDVAVGLESRGGAGPGHARKGSVGAPYAPIDGPGCTSPSKSMPKGANGGGMHHSRGGSWDDQSLYDQTFGRGVGGGGGGGGSGVGVQRDMSFGRSAERRRLLSSSDLSSGARRRGVLASIEECCACMPRCTIM